MRFPRKIPLFLAGRNWLYTEEAEKMCQELVILI